MQYKINMFFHSVTTAEIFRFFYVCASLGFVLLFESILLINTDFTADPIKTLDRI